MNLFSKINTLGQPKNSVTLHFDNGPENWLTPVAFTDFNINVIVAFA